MKPFIHENFLLPTNTAQILYHDYAKDMPIFDYHCHVPPQQIAENTRFTSITQAWLGGDHYKWRAMRAAGVHEKLVTGDGSDWDKFLAWAKTVPETLGNPLYQWTHLELLRVFDIPELLDGSSARKIYDACSEKLSQDSFRVRGLIDRFNVKALCTTDDPTDSLEHHRNIADDETFKVTVLPAWRPDMAHAVEQPEVYRSWIRKLESVSGRAIADTQDLLETLEARHQFFHEQGCRLSDHGLGMVPVSLPVSSWKMDDMFRRLMQGKQLSGEEVSQYRVTLLTELCRMDAGSGWTMQLHLNAMRNINTRAFRTLGPDTGFDSIGDWPVAEGLAGLLDRLEIDSMLPNTILYNLNPRDNEVIAALAGAFQDGKTPGKVQFGSGWWYNDQYDGMVRQMTSLASIGLLSRFVGMLTDSRSFLSYPRHEYFRRTLCALAGEWTEKGMLPDDMELIGNMVKNISYRNAVSYFGIPL